VNNDDIARGEQLAKSGRYTVNGVNVMDEPWLDEEVTDVGHFQDGEHQDDRHEEDHGEDHGEEQLATAVAISREDHGDHQDFDPDEYDVQERLRRLRNTHTAKQRLDQELRTEIELPPVTPLTQMLEQPDDPIHYRIDRLALEGARIMLSAQYKAGKTHTLLNLLRSLADGDPFLDKFTVNTKAASIVVIDDELDANTLRRWAREQKIVNTDAISDVICLRGRLSAFNLLDDRCRDQWVRRLSDLGCDYLALDCLRPVLDSLGLDENRDAGKFLVPFDTMLTEAGVNNALLVHHMGHNGERSRGDSRLQDWPDVTWRLVRESEEPDSARFFSAFGRDVNVPEGRLGFDGRRLSYVSGSRNDAKLEAAAIAVLTLLSGDAKKGGDGLSGNAIEQELPDHSQKNVRAALKKLANGGRVAVVDGPRRSKLHSIFKPCEKCGMPMLTDRPRHETCNQTGVEGLFE